MLRWLVVLFCSIAVLSIAAWAVQEEEPKTFQIDMRKMVENSHSQNPQRGLPHDWVECIESYRFEAAGHVERFDCENWTAQGVTSTLVALRIDGKLIPVLETRIADAPVNGRVVVDIVGGPGDEPFHSDRSMTDEFIARIRKNGVAKNMIRAVMSDRAEYQVMQRGFTIASIGYWGTNMRTFNEPREFERGKRDVKAVVNFYRNRTSAEPPLITNSMGNHMALGALGKDRLEGMNVLSLVPVMDGLQHHLNRQAKVFERERAEAEADGKLAGDWVFRNVYRLADGQPSFDYSRMLAAHEFVPSYIGNADYPWEGVRLKGRCSVTVLGSKDPRTLDYIERTQSYPEFVQVWNADHDLFADAPEKTRKLFADFADCLLN